MNWASVKNLLILMLAAANVFLIYNIAVQNRNKSYISEAELQNAAELLSARGQELELSSIPLRRVDADIYEGSYPGDESYYTGVAERLSGVERSKLRIYTMPDGSTRISTGESDTVRMDLEFTEDFRFSYWGNGNSPGAAYNEITADNFEEKSQEHDELGKIRMAALSKLAIAFLGADSSESELGARIDGGFADKESGLGYLLISQRLNGVEIFRHRVVCVFLGERLIHASGRWYFEGLSGKYDYELYDQVNILFTNFSELSASLGLESGETLPAVKEMSSCYATYMDPDKTALYFIPAWKLTHSDGRVVVYNAAQNTLYQSSDAS